MAKPDDNGSLPGDRRKRPTGKRKPTLGNPDADPQRIHREYVERHLGGGEPATPEAYEKGAEEWSRLPGAVTRQPGEMRGQPAEIEEESPPAPDATDDESNESDDMDGRGES